MQEQTLIRDRDLHVNDFDAATDVRQTTSMHDCYNPPHCLAMSDNDREFTTEWQMEAVHAAPAD